MRYWKARGIQIFDMGGGEYKRKYGGVWLDVPWARVSRFRSIDWGRCVAERVFSAKQRLMGNLKKLAGTKRPTETEPEPESEPKP
jgi:hypothetical protein